ncbi:hypothetical protein BDQ17DRAFT_974345 [Cyathus striatus]|nr:hypothetical protein BDQ17DRAFT_974345 [Cyathus striatus]
MSRINHSCVPNCVYVFDDASFAFYVRAGKKIVTGEQIFINYLDRCDYTFSQRATLLRERGFECMCPVCSHYSSKSASFDALCISIAPRVRALQQKLNLAHSGRTYSDVNSWVCIHDEADVILSNMERWGMVVNVFYLETVCVLWNICATLEVMHMGGKWIEKAVLLIRKYIDLKFALVGTSH